MELHEELLDQAKYLRERYAQTSHQADLRRATASAYYALFHFVIAAACRRSLGTDPQSEPLRQVMARAFVHEEMAATSKTFLSGTLPDNMRRLFPVIPEDLKNFADAFARLQDLRYSADYDLAFLMNPQDVAASIKTAEDAILGWANIQDHPTTHLYLLMLLAGKQIRARKFGNPSVS